MAIETRITKPLEHGYVQVDTKSKNGYMRYYKVPQKNANIFSNELAVNDKTMNTYSNIAYFTSILVGILATFPFVKKIDSALKRFGIQCIGAIALSTLTMIGMNEYTNAKEEEIRKKYGAKEIFYKM